MVDGERVDCPLCDRFYQNNSSGRGWLKRHAREVHLPKEPVVVGRFRYWDGEKYVEGDTHRYVCPFPGCEEKFITRQGLWCHFRRYDHFGLLIKKLRLFGRARNL